MTSFDDRQKGYENKFAHDQETQFKIKAKRNRLLAIWAAEAAGLEEDEKNAYASELVDFAVSGVSDDQIKEKILGFLRENGIAATEGEVVAHMERILVESRESFK